jgi:hypothetical protein
MSKLSRTKRFGLPQFCMIAIACCAFTVPAVGQQPAERDERDRIDAESSPSSDEKALLKAIEEQRQIAEKQRAEAEEQYRRAMSELQRARRRGSAEAQAEMASVRKQLEAAHAQLAEVLAKQKQEQQAPADPLPENTILRVYQLQHVKPQNLVEVLGPIFRNNAPRIAVDERSNAVLVAGNERQLSIVEELAQTLDREIPEIKQEDQRETLQLRIMWLLDIEEGMEPTDKLVSSQVVDALRELGFEHPKVVCRQVTTLTLRAEDRESQFNFRVPVLINSQRWTFQGQGHVEPMGDGRINLRFDLQFNQVNPGDGRSRIGEAGQIGGSIYTPLGHYTVMGTTTFVATTPAPLPEDKQPGDFGTGGMVQNQHLSAFVVYLDRAKEFPASDGQAENRDEVPR